MNYSISQYIPRMYAKSFDVQKLRRKIRKTHRVSTFGNTLGLSSRFYTSDAVKIEIEPNDFQPHLTVCTLVWSRMYGETRQYQFHVASNRELLEKLLKHNLLT